jgi:ankyrin repeat protein
VQSAHSLISAIFAEVSLNFVRCLVKVLGADINKARQSDGVAPLFAAAQIGNLAYVQFIVKELGADVNQAADDGATPLFVAAQNGSLAVVQYLAKELGADVNLATCDGATPLFMECGANINQAYVMEQHL